MHSKESSHEKKRLKENAREWTNNFVYSWMNAIILLSFSLFSFFFLSSIFFLASRIHTYISIVQPHSEFPVALHKVFVVYGATLVENIFVFCFCTFCVSVFSNTYIHRERIFICNQRSSNFAEQSIFFFSLCLRWIFFFVLFVKKTWTNLSLSFCFLCTRVDLMQKS